MERQWRAEAELAAHQQSQALETFSTEVKGIVEEVRHTTEASLTV